MTLSIPGLIHRIPVFTLAGIQEADSLAFNTRLQSLTPLVWYQYQEAASPTPTVILNSGSSGAANNATPTGSTLTYGVPGYFPNRRSILFSGVTPVLTLPIINLTDLNDSTLMFFFRALGSGGGTGGRHMAKSGDQMLFTHRTDGAFDMRHNRATTPSTNVTPAGFQTFPAPATILFVDYDETLGIDLYRGIGGAVSLVTPATKSIGSGATITTGSTVSIGNNLITTRAFNGHRDMDAIFKPKLTLQQKLDLVLLAKV